MKKRILIIDDEENIRMIYRKFFNAFGSRIFDVREASNCTEATNCLIRQHLDIIVLDINMPHINGQTMHEIIQEYDPKIKVIVASVYPIDQQKRLIPDANDYYDKSFGPMRLLEKVASHIVN